MFVVCVWVVDYGLLVVWFGGFYCCVFVWFVWFAGLLLLILVVCGYLMLVYWCCFTAGWGWLVIACSSCGLGEWLVCGYLVGWWCYSFGWLLGLGFCLLAAVAGCCLCF